MRGGDVVYVPAFTLTIATRKKPDANTLSFNRMLSWPETIRTERGFAVDFKDLSSLSFGQVSFTEDRWAKDWIGELPLGITLKDGRQLRTYAAMDYLLLFAMDDFGVVEMTPDKIARIDFVNDIAEEVFHCDPPGPR